MNAMLPAARVHQKSGPVGDVQVIAAEALNFRTERAEEGHRRGAAVSPGI